MSEPIERIEGIGKGGKSPSNQFKPGPDQAQFEKLLAKKGEDADRLAAQGAEAARQKESKKEAKRVEKPEAEKKTKVSKTEGEGVQKDAGKEAKKVEKSPAEVGTGEKAGKAEQLTPEQLAVQAKDVAKQIASVRKKVEKIPGLQFRKETQSVVRRRLGHVNDSLKVALGKVGVDYVPPTVSAKANPVQKFLGYLTHGQAQLESLSGQIKALAAEGENFTPAQMMGVQLKVSMIQQEVEFFSNLLSKALESMKTLMNVQV